MSWYELLSSLVVALGFGVLWASVLAAFCAVATFAIMGVASGSWAIGVGLVWMLRHGVLMIARLIRHYKGYYDAG